ncbi:MAG: hypothetical protein HY708_01825 [Ignavibacteriae bacterium]|nr:hypothetical protein [Ignavibacteriota bacterium]
MIRQRSYPLLCALLAASVLACNTGVEESPQPGIVRVTLQANPADTTIIILTDTVRVTDQDSIDVKIFQGKVFSGVKFATIFRTITSYRSEDMIYNVLAREAGTYKTHVLYESYVPPTNYTKLQLGVTATLLKFRDVAPIPLQLRPNDPPLLDFDVEFQVSENRVTEIMLQIDPLRSLSRYRDLYYFERKMRVLGVRQF